jgi:hypothetical protein
MTQCSIPKSNFRRNVTCVGFIVSPEARLFESQLPQTSREHYQLHQYSKVLVHLASAALKVVMMQERDAIKFISTLIPKEESARQINSVSNVSETGRV